MPALSRHNTRPLLRRVKNRVYATEADHVQDESRSAEVEDEEEGQTRASKRRKTVQGSATSTVHLNGGEKKAAIRKTGQQQQQQPTPPASGNVSSPQLSRQGMESPEEDVMADPISDIEEEDAAATTKKTIGDVRTFKKPTTYTRKTGTGASNQDTRETNETHSELDGLSDVPAWFRKQVAESKTGANKKKFENIHAPRPAVSWGSRKAPATYSRKVPRVAKPESQSPKTKGKAKKQEETVSTREFVQPRAWRPKAIDGDTNDDKENEARSFQTPRGLDDDNGSDSDPLSSLSSVPSSPEVLKGSLGNGAENSKDPDCPICGVQIDILLKQAFEDEHLHGRYMNFTWQQRFCWYHRKHAAQEAWSERGYPEIDWNRLDQRLRKFDQHLREVLTGTRASRYRDRLREKIKGGKRSAMQNFQTMDGDMKGTVAGYYGPRGEQVMTDHILTHLADDIREQAARDKLMATSGVSGGVAGFVHLVLLPELAERLVMEDLGTDDARLIEDTLRDSADIGELLYPEIAERISDVSSDQE